MSSARLICGVWSNSIPTIRPWRRWRCKTETSRYLLFEEGSELAEAIRQAQTTELVRPAQLVRAPRFWWHPGNFPRFLAMMTKRERFPIITPIAPGCARREDSRLRKDEYYWPMWKTGKRDQAAEICCSKKSCHKSIAPRGSCQPTRLLREPNLESEPQEALTQVWGTPRVTAVGSVRDGLALGKIRRHPDTLKVSISRSPGSPGKELRMHRATRLKKANNAVTYTASAICSSFQPATRSAPHRRGSSGTPLL